MVFFACPIFGGVEAHISLHTVSLCLRPNQTKSTRQFRSFHSSPSYLHQLQALWLVSKSMRHMTSSNQLADWLRNSGSPGFRRHRVTVPFISAIVQRLALAVYNGMSPEFPVSTQTLYSLPGFAQATTTGGWVGCASRHRMRFLGIEAEHMSTFSNCLLTELSFFIDRPSLLPSAALRPRLPALPMRPSETTLRPHLFPAMPWSQTTMPGRRGMRST